MFGNLFIDSLDNQSIDSFIMSLRQKIGCPEWEERSSASYVDERYFLCHTLGLEIRVATADDSEFRDFSFWLSFRSNGLRLQDNSFIDGLADCTARKLAFAGHVVARPLNIDQINGGALIYKLRLERENPTAGAVVTERI
jgi:hypothetical protein